MDFALARRQQRFCDSLAAFATSALAQSAPERAVGFTLAASSHGTTRVGCTQAGSVERCVGLSRQAMHAGDPIQMTNGGLAKTVLKRRLPQRARRAPQPEGAQA